jgi:hypothetical protein
MLIRAARLSKDRALKILIISIIMEKLHLLKKEIKEGNRAKFNI